jgi:hypothetical protein
MRIAALVLGACLAIGAVQQPLPINALTFSQRDFFQQNRVWTAQLTMSESAWNELQPRYGAGGAGGFGPGGMLGSDGVRNGVAARQGIEFTTSTPISRWTGRSFATWPCGTRATARSCGRGAATRSR